MCIFSLFFYSAYKLYFIKYSINKALLKSSAVAGYIYRLKELYSSDSLTAFYKLI